MGVMGEGRSVLGWVTAVAIAAGSGCVVVFLEFFTVCPIRILQ